MSKLSAFGTVLRLGNTDPVYIASGSWAANVATINTQTAHGLTTGQTVKIRGCTPVAYNVSAVCTVVDADTFTIPLAIADPGAITSPGWCRLANTFADIANVQDITGPSISTDMLDASTHDSPSAFKEKVAGMVDVGDVTFPIVFDPAATTHIAMRQDLVARKQLRSFQLAFNPAAPVTWEFEGAVQTYTPAAPVQGLLTANVGLTISGVPELA